MRALLPLVLLLAACAAEKPEDTDVPDGIDADEDGYGPDVDCDDGDAAVHPGATEVCNDVDDDCDGGIDVGATDATTFYGDGDGDGHGDDAQAVAACEAPAGTVATGGDCDDADAAWHPGAEESDCTDPNDYNCDGSIGYADEDGDGWAACEECDDLDLAVNPDAVETCNELDDDCDAAIDEAGASGEATWYADADGDGFGDPATTVAACGAPAGFVADATDCDDTDATLHPDTVWYRDVDADGHGGTLSTLTQCAAPAGYARTDDDCDDYDATVSPSAAEVCDAADVDEDCDTVADDADASASAGSTSTWYRDGDGDGYGGATTLQLCDAPAGYVATAGDCDDAVAAINPGAAEVCDSADTDEDCDGAVEDADATVSSATKSTWYRDADADTYGSAARTTSACDAPAGYVADATDCDDAAATVSPAATEVCDASDRDEDCDGAADDEDASVSASTRSTFYRDADADTYGTSGASVAQCDAPAGYVSVAGDCDDAAATIRPGGTEVCDAANADEDCDGVADDADPSVSATGKSTWYADTDSDGFGDAGFTGARCDAGTGWVADATDCDDSRAAVSPAGTETCATTYDDDCDGVTNERNAAACTTWFLDADDDGHGVTTSQCWCDETGDYTATTAQDCDDADATVMPGATETCDGEDDDCDTLVDDADPDAVTTTWYADVDEDGYGDAADPTDACEEPTGYVADATDCDDADADVNPAASERYGDAIDDDCDGDTEPTDYESCSGYAVPGDYATITAALAALENTTATICVGAGAFSDSFTFDGTGSVTVQGAGRGVTTLTGSPRIEPRGGSFTLQGMSIVGTVGVFDSASGTTEYEQRVYLYDLEIDSTTHGVWILRSDWSHIWVWMDGLDIDAGSGSSYGGVAMEDMNAQTSAGWQVVLYNVYVHDTATCVRADMDENETSAIYLEDSTLYNCGTGVLLDSLASAADVSFYVNNTVLYGMTTVGINDNSDSYGEIIGRYNALYGNATNYAGSATAGEAYVTSDPMLDFSYAPPRPEAGSPLIDAGGMWLGPTADYWGTPRSWPPDIGAIELE